MPEDGEYEFWVEQHDADVGTNQSYGVTWWAMGSSLIRQGDFNDDGMIDGADLDDWKLSFGVDDEADADGDGDSDGADFLIWQRNYGLAAASGGSANVPEPSACLLAAIALPLLLRKRQRV